jgi:hypothetical protein
MAIERITNKYKKDENQPDEVWSNTSLDEIRREECLCLNCDRKNEEVPYSSCPVSAKLYKVCVDYDMAMAVSRCGATDEDGDLMYKPIK